MKAHLFPRSLVRRIRRNQKAVFEGNRTQPGLRLSQSGLWDDAILCERHESALASADDYIARFCRKFEKYAVLSETGNAYISPNSRPDLLVRFAAATVWRHAVSKHGQMHGLDLGPYRQKIEQHLFQGNPLQLQTLVGRSNIIDPDGKRLEFGLAPYKRKLLQWTVWHFTIGGFDFYLKTDQRPFPLEWGQFLANDNDPITTPLIDPVRLSDVRMFEPIFAQMLKGRLR